MVDDAAIFGLLLGRARPGLLLDAAVVGGDLLVRSLGLSERVGLRRAGGVNLYTYDMGATQSLVDRLALLGATVTQSVDASGRCTVSAEFQGEPPMLFVERAVSGGRYGTMGWPEDFTPATLNRMRLALLANANDVARIAAVMRGFGEPLTPEMLQLIKRYNFDSPGLAFSRDNYEAWMRLAAGQGTVSDARYLIHKAREIAAFQRAGFDFNPDAWASMGRHPRTSWHRAFDTAYLNAHAEALAAEFNFVVTQVARATDGRVVLTREVAAAIDGTFSGEDARTYMRVDGYVLQDHPNFYIWSARAGETVELDAVTRARLGSAIYQGLLRARIGGSTRAAAVRDGAAPTLRELLAIVKAMRM